MSGNHGINAMFKLQVQDDDNSPDGKLLTFEREADARTQLEALFPVLVKMERYAGPKRTRVLHIIGDEDDWPAKK